MREGIVAAIDRKLQEFREIRGMDEMSEKRLGLIDRFIRATRMVDRYVDTVIAIRFGILAGARATQPMEQGMYQNRKSTLMEQFEAARPQL
jgi:hypothetical protein